MARRTQDRMGKAVGRHAPGSGGAIRAATFAATLRKSAPLFPILLSMLTRAQVLNILLDANIGSGSAQGGLTILREVREEAHKLAPNVVALHRLGERPQLLGGRAADHWGLVVAKLAVELAQLALQQRRGAGVGGGKQAAR